MVMFRNAVWAVILCTGLGAWCAEFSPTGVMISGECAKGHGVWAMVDGNPSTFATLLDDTPAGRDKSANPPFATCPVTASFLLDLGMRRRVSGIRFTAQPTRWRASLPYSVTIASCTDAAGNGRKIFATEKILPFAFCGDSAFVDFPADETRFVEVRVNESSEQEIRNAGFYANWTAAAQRAWGHPVPGRTKDFITDIAEVTLYDAPPPDYPRPNAAHEAFPVWRQEKDWLMQDFGIDHFTEKSALRADPAWRKRCLARRKIRLSRVARECPRILYAKHYTISGDAETTGTAMQSDENNRPWPKNLKPFGQLCILTVLPDGSVTNEVLLTAPKGCIRDPALSPDAKTVVFSMRRRFYESPFLGRKRVANKILDPRHLMATDEQCDQGNDYHLYSMDLATRTLKQLTFTPVLTGQEVVDFWRHSPGSVFVPTNLPLEKLRLPLPCSDYEPCFAPNGTILFTSTRCEAVIPCHWSLLSNLYACEPDGSRIRRLTFDGGASVGANVLGDGRILYMRYEYNDRSARFQQPLFTMDENGFAQTEYYGNNSYYPASLHHFRPIPGCEKLLGILCGHHVAQKGRLVVLDRRKGTQGDSGITFVAGSSPDEEPGAVPSHYEKDPRVTGRDPDVCDHFAQFGPQWQYPYPLGGDEWICTFLPEGTLRGRFGSDPNFGIYWQNVAGERELLAYDPFIECSQPIPVVPRKLPPVRATRVDRSKSMGEFYVRDVYIGPGLAGVPRGTVKKLRIVSIESRPMFLYTGSMFALRDSAFDRYIRYAGDISGEGVAVNGGTWDIKHVFGEVEVTPDGGCAFACPADNPVYFQLLDAEGRCVQTMRSWTLVRPGERFFCIGCHEDKMQTYPTAVPTAPVRVQQIRPADGQPAHPIFERLKNGGLFASAVNRLGVGCPRSVAPDAPQEGFSYPRLVQPILDRNCVRCHDGKGKNASRPDLTGAPEDGLRIRLINEWIDAANKAGKNQWGFNSWQFKSDPHRTFTKSYITLTSGGRQTKRLNWYSSTGIAEMLPPRAQGSSNSSIMEKFTPAHHGVRATDADRRVFACWIDLAVPFGGSYSEATRWTPEDRYIFEYHQNKRTHFALDEVKTK